MLIKVEKSKTDQLGRGDEVVIAHSKENVCPVFLLKEYLKKLESSPSSSEFILRALVKTKSSYRVVQVDKTISYATFRGRLTQILQSIVPSCIIEIFGILASFLFVLQSCPILFLLGCRRYNVLLFLPRSAETAKINLERLYLTRVTRDSN